MRSRYSAYTLNDINYIAQTMQGPAAKDFNPDETKEWASRITWKSLTVIRAWNDSDTHAFVEFIACYERNKKAETMYEISEFIQKDGRWFYTNGTTSSISRNQMCPCNSGKKAKRCCFSV